MSTLYTFGEYVVLSPSQFSSYSTIQYAPDDSTSVVELGLASSGSVNFSSRLGSRSAIVDGATGNDNLTLGGGNDSVWGNSGNDTVYGGSGNDFLIGDWGDGTSTGDDRLYGGDGDDELSGGLGNDNLDGGNGDDIFTIVDTNPGNDTFKGGAGSDSVWIWDARGDGTSRFDLNRLVLDAASSVEFLLFDESYFDVGGTDGADVFDLGYAEGFTWNGWEWAAGVGIDLRLGSDRFDGGVGVETVTAHDGGDYVSLGDGDDQLVLADGSLNGDTLYGGNGNDTLVVWGTDESGTSFVRGVHSLDLGSAASFETVRIYAYVVEGTSGADRYDLTGVTTLDINNWEAFHLLDGNDTFRGSAGVDGVNGGDGDDSLEGNAGDDRFYGGGGNDALSGGEDRDYLEGQGGRDTLYGGAGNDLFHCAGGAEDADVFYGGEGSDTLRIADGAVLVGLAFDASVSIENVSAYYDSSVKNAATVNGTIAANRFDFTGMTVNSWESSFRFLLGAGDDWISTASFSLNADGGTGNDTLIGSDLDDVLIGGLGTDSLVGGLGNDRYRIDNSTDVIVDVANGGNDTIETGMGRYRLGDIFENLTHLGTNAFTGTGNSQANRMVGGSGADTLFGLLGADSLDGGAANDRLEGGYGADILDGGLGVDTMVGGVGNDLFIVDNRSDVIIEQSGGGLDTVTCRTDVLVLSAYVDAVVVDRTAGAQVTGNLLSNRITGGSGNDTLIGAYGNDVLTGGDGADRLEGGVGNDTLSGQGGQNVLIGGKGNDLYFVTSSADTVFEASGEGADTAIISARSFSSSANIENLDIRLKDFGGTYSASDQDNLIELSYSNRSTRHGSIVYGLGGNDTLSTNDYTSSLNADSLYGGLGDDTYIVTSDRVLQLYTFIERPDEGTDTVLSAYSAHLRDNIEVLRLTGTDDINGSGNDLDNVIVGNDGRNILTAGGLEDDIAGSDTLTGGAGADQFSFHGLAMAQHITDMTVGEDKITLRHYVFGAMPYGRLAEDAFKDLSTGIVDASDRVLYRPDTGEVFWDADGSGINAAVVFLILDNHSSVTARDFLIN